jgi:hypothetical protein
LSLSDEKRCKLTRAVNFLDQARLEKDDNHSETILAKVSELYNQRTTHLIIDLNAMFNEEATIISLHEKCVLILAALNRCKIVAYQWLKKSQQKMKWLNEENFLLENFFDQDLNSYDRDNFDVKLISKRVKLNIFHF